MKKKINVGDTVTLKKNIIKHRDDVHLPDGWDFSSSENIVLTVVRFEGWHATRTSDGAQVMPLHRLTGGDIKNKRYPYNNSPEESINGLLIPESALKIVKKVRRLTKEEQKKYQVSDAEMYFLLDTEKDSLFLSSDTIDFCVESLHKMTPKHPRYKFLELVKK